MFTGQVQLSFNQWKPVAVADFVAAVIRSGTYICRLLVGGGLIESTEFIKLERSWYFVLLFTLTVGSACLGAVKKYGTHKHAKLTFRLTGNNW